MLPRLTSEKLQELLDDIGAQYTEFLVPKADGSLRRILAPKPALKRVQRSLLKTFEFPISDAAHGYVTGRSVKSAAEPHVGKAVVVGLDVRDFFHQVTFARVESLLLGQGYAPDAAALVAALCTAPVPGFERCCVQGAPTSPALCNAVALRLDQRLLSLSVELGFSYTRYADDLAFSGDDPKKVRRLIFAARRIAEEEAFPLNEKKTQVMLPHQHQVVVGVTVNQELGLSRQERRRLRAALHQEKDEGDKTRNTGRLAFLAMLNPRQAAELDKCRKKD